MTGVLFRYLMRHYLRWFLIAFGAMVAVISLVDLIELLRRAAGREAVGGALAVKMVLLRLPHLSQEAVPFAVLFAGILSLSRLGKSSELIVARAAGVSVWQFLLPAMSAAFMIGVIKVAILNSIAAAMLGRFESLEGRWLTGASSLLASPSGGLWLRDVTADGGETVFHASGVVVPEMRFSDPILFLFNKPDSFVGRIDAATAWLREGTWVFADAWLTGIAGEGRFVPRHSQPTALTAARIQESFATPQSVSFWRLPHFARALEATGFSADRHRLRWHALMAEPFLLVAMIMIAATFSLRLSRRGGAALLLVAGILSGFALYVATNIIHALGLGGSVPVLLAAWAPAGISLATGLATLMHLEDG